MTRLALALALLIASLAAALAQSPVSVIGPITPGDCTMFSSNTVLKDAGFPCPGSGFSLVLPNGTTATTQTLNDNTTKVATDAFVQNQIAAIPPTAPGGVSGNVQFNNAGTFGGLTNAQLTADINTFTAGLSGAVPPSGGGTTNFLRADGTFAAPPGGGAVSSVFTRTGAVVAVAGDYNAGQITYTPVGTGGVATTPKAILDRTVWANDYGAVCNGSTDDHTAFQNAINQGQTAGLPVRFVGNCAITTGLSITTSVDFGGFSAPQSKITVGSVSVLGITITTPNTVPVYLHDFGMAYSSAANAGVAAITITGTASNENAGSRFERLVLNGGIAIGIDFVKASAWVLSNSIVVSAIASGIAVRIANQNNGDSGDSTIYGSLIQAGSAGTGITWNSSGGTRIENNKILGSGMNTGIAVSLSSGVSTSDLFIVGNSIEGLATAGNSISMVRAGTTGSLSNVMISNNELGGGQVCVNIPTDANGVWINNLNIHGNNCEPVNNSSTFGFIVNTVASLVLSNNNIWAPGAGTNQPVSVTGFSAATCVLGPNPRLGTFTASAVGTCTVIAPN